MSDDDFYSILGVSQTATAAELKERFRFLSHAYHPDKFATETQRQTAEEQFKKVNEAYRILSDPASRASYDASHAKPSDKPPRAAYRQPTPDAARPPKRSGCFLRLVKWICIGVALLVALLVGLAIFESNRETGEIEASKHRIAPSEIELVDLALKPYYGGGAYDLVGRVRNRSQLYTLDTVGLTLTMRDILPSGSSEVVGEDDIYISDTVPPGQTRDVSVYVTFENLPKPLGHYEWTYVITQIRGK